MVYTVMLSTMNMITITGDVHSINGIPPETILCTNGCILM